MSSTTRSRVAASAAVVLLLAAAIAATVHSSFTDAVANDGNTFRAGTIDLQGDGSASALFDLDGLRPGVKVKRCFRVRYSSTGDVPSTVHIYGKTAGALAPYVTLFFWRGSTPAGTSPEDTRACKDFAPEWLGSFWGGTLADFPQTAEHAFRDPTSEWRDGAEAVYQVMAVVSDDNAAQGLSASHSITFEARSK